MYYLLSLSCYLSHPFPIDFSPLRPQGFNAHRLCLFPTIFPQGSPFPFDRRVDIPTENKAASFLLQHVSPLIGYPFHPDGRHLLNPGFSGPRPPIIPPHAQHSFYIPSSPHEALCVTRLPSLSSRERSFSPLTLCFNLHFRRNTFLARFTSLRSHYIPLFTREHGIFSPSPFLANAQPSLHYHVPV